jgi:hypothetical protein
VSYEVPSVAIPIVGTRPLFSIPPMVVEMTVASLPWLSEVAGLGAGGKYRSPTPQLGRRLEAVAVIRKVLLVAHPMGRSEEGPGR